MTGGAKPHDDIVDLADHLHDNFNASQADEECFRYMKNSKVIKGKRRFRRPEKAMAVVLAKQVLSKVMKYKEVEIKSENFLEVVPNFENFIQTILVWTNDIVSM